VEEVELLAHKAHHGDLDAAISVARRHRHRKVDFFFERPRIDCCHSVLDGAFVYARDVLANNYTSGLCDSMNYVFYCSCCNSSCVYLI
jgi:hypothetical protein